MKIVQHPEFEHATIDRTNDDIHNYSKGECTRYGTQPDERPCELLTDSVLKSITGLLGEDAKKCYRGLQEFQNIAKN